MNAERYKEATKVVLKCSYFMFWLNWANTCKHFLLLFPYLFLFFFTPTLANIYSTGPTLANFGARQQTSPNPKPCCSELYYAPTRALEDWRNGPHGGARRPSRRHQPAGFLHGRTQDLHWRRDFGAVATGAALHFVAANLEQQLWRELAAAGDAWRAWRLLRAWCVSSHGVTDPPSSNAKHDFFGATVCLAFSHLVV